MRLFKFKDKEQQKGTALVMAMFIVTGILTLVGLLSLSENNTRSILRKNSMQTARDEIAKSLISFITNPQVIKKQALEANNGVSRGHAMLYNCLNGTDVGGVRCARTENITKDADGYYSNLTRLPLLAPDDFQYPGEKQDADGRVKNCPANNPNNTHPSCLIAGQRNGGNPVGYNLRGETGVLSPCFPFEPVVYLNPYCSDGASECELAEDMEFVYQLIHKQFNQECPIGKAQTQFNLGTFPKKPEVISTPRHALVDYQCNPGAFITGYESDGSISCECRFPYSQVPGQRNEKGVLCQKIDENCPGGSVLVRRDAEGRPVCKVLSNTQQEEVGPIKAVTPGTGVDDSQVGAAMTCTNSGWLQDININCTGVARTVREPGWGSSCLFLYQYVKMIDDGKSRIRGYVPTEFYRRGDTLPCRATKESFVRGWYNQDGAGWNVLCGTAIATSLFLGIRGNRFIRILVGIVGMADLIFGETTGEVRRQSYILDGALAGISAGIQAGKWVFPPISVPAAWAASVGAAVGFSRWQVRVDYDCFPIRSENKSINCNISGTCYHFDGEYTE